MNAFELLGMKASFDIDSDALEKKYMQLCFEHHPDKFTDPIEQIEASETSAEINAAYQAIKEPESRANVLLSVLGGPDSSDDKSLPPTLLVDMLEIREEMEAAQYSQDTTKLTELKQWANTERQAYLNRVRELFKQVETADKTNEKTLQSIRMQLNALRYIERMIEQLDPGYNPIDADF